MDLAALCDSYVELKMVQMDTISLFLVLMQPLPATQWLPTVLHPCSACGITVLGISIKIYLLKWQVIQLAIHSTVGS